MNPLYEAEVAVLGSLMIEPALMEDCYLQPEEMQADDRHGLLLSYMRHVFEQDGTIDMALMHARSGSKLDRVGGILYLTEIAGTVPTPANFEHYQSVVRNAYIQRETARLMDEMAEVSRRDGLDVRQHIAGIQSQLEVLADMAPQKKGSGLVHMESVLDGHVDTLGERAKKRGMTGPPTASQELDKLTGGHQPGDMEIIAARPSIGKTAYMLNDALRVARAKGVAAVFSAEMGALSVVERMVCAMGNLDGGKMRSGAFDDSDWDKYSFARGELEQLSLYIDETSSMTLQHIRSGIKQLAKKHPYNKIVVYIDYLQLIIADSRFGSRREEVEHISRSLKRLARQFGITVVALSQLSRGVEQRTDKRPMMSDIREAGGIEQDADIIAFLYRDEYYNKETEKPNIVEVIIAKQRNGQTGTIEMVFLRNFGKFVDIDRSQKAGAANGKD